MSLVDRSKLRKDVLEHIDSYATVRIDAAREFLSKPENQNIDFNSLWGRVMEGNQTWFKEGNMDWYSYDYLSKEEMIFLARMHRSVVDFIGAHNQRLNTISQNIVIEDSQINGVHVEKEIVPGANKKRILLYFHGGGWILGNPSIQKRLATVKLGETTKMQVVSVDYRLAPEHPFPAGLDDCITVYKGILDSGIRSDNIILGGDSAGGYYTLVTMLKLRELGLELPKAGICLCPATDLSLSSESYTKNMPTDPVLADVGCYWWGKSFLNERNGKDPAISPLFADLKGLPPLLVQISNCEMLYDEAKEFSIRAKRSSVSVKYKEWDSMTHVFQEQNFPESKEAHIHIRKFIMDLYN